MQTTIPEPWLGQVELPEYAVFAGVEQLLQHPEHRESLSGEIPPETLEAIKAAAQFRLEDVKSSALIAQIGFDAEPWHENGRQLGDPRPAYAATIAKIQSLITWLKTELKGDSP